MEFGLLIGKYKSTLVANIFFLVSIRYDVMLIIWLIV